MVINSKHSNKSKNKGKGKGKNKSSSNRSNKEEKNNAEMDALIGSLTRLSSALSDLNEEEANDCNPPSSLDPTGDGTCNHSSSPSTSESISPPSTPHHWNDPIPPTIIHAYETLTSGAEYLHASATKFALLGAIPTSSFDGTLYAAGSDLQRGCETMAAGCLALYCPGTLLQRPTREIVRSKCRAAVATTMSLVQTVADTATVNIGNRRAICAGAVWAACDGVKDIPMGNRRCTRRESLRWVEECDETMEEFEGLLRMDPQETDVDENCDGDDGGDEGNDVGWDDFCDNAGTGDRYSVAEMNVVRPAIALIKCCRGVVNLSLWVYDHVGDSSSIDDNYRVEKKSSDSDDNSNVDNIKARGEIIHHWIRCLHETVLKAVEEMTNLGMALYPPLMLDNDGVTTSSVQVFARRQKDALMIILGQILDATVVASEEDEGATDNKDRENKSYAAETVIIPSRDIMRMVGKLQDAVGVRFDEVESAIERAVGASSNLVS